MEYQQRLPTVRGKYRYNINVGKTCWFKVDSIVDVVFRPMDLLDLKDFLQNKPKEIACYVIGVGSNLLLRDKGFKGVIIKLGREFNYISHQDNILRVGASVMDINIAEYAKQHELGGLEFLSGIPGTIGGALAMNAGSFDKEVADIMLEATAINITTGEMKIFKNSNIGYYYRGKTLSNNWIFTEVKLQSYHDTRDNIIDIIASIKQKRINSQPIKTNTGGSTFKNPRGYKAWQLIDKAGCRGLSIGEAVVSQQHCNFFINKGNASANDIEGLIELVQRRVLDSINIELQPEIKIVGKK